MSSQLIEKPEVAPTATATPTAPVAQPSVSNGIAYTPKTEARRRPEPNVIVHQSSPSGNGWSVLGLAIGVMLFLLVFGIVESIILNSSHAPASTPSTTTTSASNTSNGTTSQNAPAVTQVVAPPHQTYNAKPPVAPAGNVVNLTLTVKELLISIAPGVAYHAWTFNGTVPGPVLRVRQGQTVHFTLINDGNMPHSIDFHAAQTPWNVNYQEVPQGKSFSFNWQANYPGVFMYHCGAPTVIYHMANGMYGMIIVDPANGYAPAQEYALVQSEFYTALQPDGSYSSDPTKLSNGTPDYVVFNGYANQYKASPLVVKAGQRVRLFIVNAGPTEFSAFHVIGAIFSDVYIDGNPANHMVGDQTVMVPPGGGVIVEFTIPAPGLYPFVTHSFVDVGKGALGVIKAI